MKTRFFYRAGIVACAVLLGGCSATTLGDLFKGGNDDVVVVNAPAVPAPGMLTPTAPMVTASAATPAPGQPYAGNFDPNNLMSVYNQISRGGVQMYDPSNPGAYYPSLSNVGGIPAPQDSRVTLFPVEGDYFGGGMASSGIGGAYGGGYTSSYVQSHRPGDAQIHFGHGSSRLSAQDEQRLEQVAEQAKFSPVDRISIEGHASTRAATGDPVADRIVNLKQSMDRTYAVSRSLIRKGVPAEKIRAVSWGDTRNPDGMAEDQSRRVDIYTGGP